MLAYKTGRKRMRNRMDIGYITANYLKQGFKTATNIQRVIFLRFTPILVS